MTYTETTQIIAQVTTSIVAIIAAVASLLSALRVKDLKDDNIARTIRDDQRDAHVNGKLNEIHTLTNSTLTAATTKIAELQRLVEVLAEERRAPTHQEHEIAGEGPLPATGKKDVQE